MMSYLVLDGLKILSGKMKVGNMSYLVLDGLMTGVDCAKNVIFCENR